MAYKPKYAQTKAGPGKPAMGQTQPNREEPGQKPKKMGRKLLIFFIILGIVVVPLSSFLTVRLMGGIWENVGRPKRVEQSEVADMQILEFFEGTVTEQITAVRNSMVPVNVPDFPEELSITRVSAVPASALSTSASEDFGSFPVRSFQFSYKYFCISTGLNTSLNNIFRFRFSKTGISEYNLTAKFL